VPLMADYLGEQLDLALPLVKDAAGVRDERHALRNPKTPAEMTNDELLTVILGFRHAPVSAQLAAAFPSLRDLAADSIAWREAGLTGSGAERLHAVFEIARRHGETEWLPGAAFRGSGDIYAHFRERLAAAEREEFYGILLDNKHRKLRDVLLSVGSLTASIVHPRDVFLQVIRHAAAAVIFVHNHPSGDPTPSREDLDITRRLREVGDVIGVRVLDHIVIGKGRYVSFVDDGYW
jgi:DNA repair protein RadC